MAPLKPGKVDWVAVSTLVCTVSGPVISLIIGAVLYLMGRFDQIESSLHAFDLRFTRIETRMGIDEPVGKVAKR